MGGVKKDSARDGSYYDGGKKVKKKRRAKAYT